MVAATVKPALSLLPLRLPWYLLGPWFNISALEVPVTSVEISTLIRFKGLRCVGPKVVKQLNWSTSWYSWLRYKRVSNQTTLSRYPHLPICSPYVRQSKKVAQIDTNLQEWDFQKFSGFSRFWGACILYDSYIYIHIIHSLQVDLVIIDPSLGCPTKKQWPAQASRFGLTMGVKKLWCQAEVVEQNCPGCEF